jgi:hypothetical protein
MALTMPLPPAEGSVVADLKCEVVTAAWHASSEHGDNQSAQASVRAFQGPEQSSRLLLFRLQQRDGVSVRVFEPSRLPDFGSR